MIKTPEQPLAHLFLHTLSSHIATPKQRLFWKLTQSIEFYLLPSTNLRKRWMNLLACRIVALLQSISPMALSPVLYLVTPHNGRLKMLQVTRRYIQTQIPMPCLTNWITCTQSSAKLPMGLQWTLCIEVLFRDRHESLRTLLRSFNIIG